MCHKMSEFLIMLYCVMANVHFLDQHWCLLILYFAGYVFDIWLFRLLGICFSIITIDLYIRPQFH